MHSRILAEERLSEDGEETALGLLTDFGAHVGELVGGESRIRGVDAVQVGKVEDVDGAALRVGEGAQADEVLSLVDGWHGHDGAGEEGGCDG